MAGALQQVQRQDGVGQAEVGKPLQQREACLAGSGRQSAGLPGKRLLLLCAKGGAFLGQKLRPRRKAGRQRVSGPPPGRGSVGTETIDQLGDAEDVTLQKRMGAGGGEQNAEVGGGIAESFQRLRLVLLGDHVEKAMGSIAKSGTSPIVEVLSPAEKPAKHGLIFAATPASDIVCGPSQLASGIGLQVFMTGRGTPYGLDVAPVIKVCSRTEMKEHWFDLIDISAGQVATGEKTIADVGQEIFDMILDVASGIRQPYSDQYGFHNDLCIFNPAPIT